MPRILALMLVVLLLMCGTLACGDDDDDGNGDNGNPSVSVSPTNEPSETPDGGDDKETPDANETPGEDGDATATPANVTPSDRGTRAIVIVDPTVWFAENYPGVSPGDADCQYNPAEFFADCGGLGEFSPDPPLIGAGVECAALIVNNEPIALRCTSADPLSTAYYDIQE